ncbi:MAG: ergosterol biosynthesis protein [Myxococcales bacterium]|nr:ergosterol biosynthesis protein [Myxococcales bacterium]
MPAFFALIALYGLIFVLHLIIPGRWVTGYARDARTGAPLRYRLNGLRVALVTLALYGLAGAGGLIAWDALYVHRWAALAAACALGLVFTAALVLPAAPRRGLLADLFLGRLENPQLADGHVDAKMVLYLVGAVTLELNLLSYAAHHLLLHPGAASPGVALHVALFSFFVFDYLWFERVHLYTYDLFAERVGFKLGWGCMCFYPFFYALGLGSVVERPDPGASTLQLVLCALLFFAGWVLARGANMQKFWFKTQPERAAFGVLVPETLEGDGRRLLVNGFWGVARHVNYLGEITMATALALALGYPGALWPWLYPLYYVALLLPRQRDDDRRCAAKYGALWAEYERRVPYRIIPGIY